MIKKYLTEFKIMNLTVFILLASFSLLSYSKEGHLSLNILSIYSPFNFNGYEDSDTFTDNFHDAISTVHSPVLVDYDNQKSLLIFVPAKKDDPERGNLIYNFNLGNQRMNEVGRISDDEILSIFGYIYSKDDAGVIILQKKPLDSEKTLYGTYRFSILKKDGGLYIQSFKTDRIIIMSLDNCIDGGTDYQGNKQICKYKDAASIKKYFDSMGDSE